MGNFPKNRKLPSLCPYSASDLEIILCEYGNFLFRYESIYGEAAWYGSGEFFLDKCLNYLGMGFWDGKKAGATHIIIGKIEMFEYMFESDADNPLEFKMSKQGYVFQSGAGKVTDNTNGKIWNLIKGKTIIAAEPIDKVLFIEKMDDFIDSRDGEIYNIIKIGTQIWMAENLKATHYSNGDDIPNIIEGGQLSGFTIGAYCWYNNDISWKDAYGALYNWYAVVDSRELCPDGWHTPADAEWTILTDYLGGENIAGGKMKSTRTVPDAHPRLDSPNTGATNESGFSGLPGGTRNDYGTFYSHGRYGYFWSSSEASSNYAWTRSLFYHSSNVFRFNANKQHGFSVRCLRD